MVLASRVTLTLTRRLSSRLLHHRQVVVPDGGARQCGYSSARSPGYPALALSRRPISVRFASRNMNGMLPLAADVRERRRLWNGMGRESLRARAGPLLSEPFVGRATTTRRPRGSTGTADPRPLRAPLSRSSLARISGTELPAATIGDSGKFYLKLK